MMRPYWSLRQGLAFSRLERITRWAFDPGADRRPSVRLPVAWVALVVHGLGLVGRLATPAVGVAGDRLQLWDCLHVFEQPPLF